MNIGDIAATQQPVRRPNKLAHTIIFGPKIFLDKTFFRTKFFLCEKLVYKKKLLLFIQFFLKQTTFNYNIILIIITIILKYPIFLER